MSKQPRGWESLFNCYLCSSKPSSGGLGYFVYLFLVSKYIKTYLKKVSIMVEEREGSKPAPCLLMEAKEQLLTVSKVALGQRKSGDH